MWKTPFFSDVTHFFVRSLDPIFNASRPLVSPPQIVVFSTASAPPRTFFFCGVVTPYATNKPSSLIFCPHPALYVMCAKATCNHCTISFWGCHAMFISCSPKARQGKHSAFYTSSSSANLCMRATHGKGCKIKLAFIRLRTIL